MKQVQFFYTRLYTTKTRNFVKWSDQNASGILMTITTTWRGFCFGNNFKNENGLIDQIWVWASIHVMSGSGGYADRAVDINKKSEIPENL